MSMIEENTAESLLVAKVTMIIIIIIIIVVVNFFVWPKQLKLLQGRLCDIMWHVISLSGADA